MIITNIVTNIIITDAGIFVFICLSLDVPWVVSWVRVLTAIKPGLLGWPHAK